SRSNIAANLKPEGIRGPEGEQAALKCAACHQPTPDGRYMEPIRFESHCAACHAGALVYDVERFRTRPAPHGHPPELLRGLLRERYTEFIQQHPHELGIEIKLERPLPGRPGLQGTAEGEWTGGSRQVDQADRILFQGAGGCQYCHRVDATDRGWQIAPTTIPKRWLGFSRFNHFSHRLNPEPVTGQENCTACHEGA